jgi:hypothetical protein
VHTSCRLPHAQQAQLQALAAAQLQQQMLAQQQALMAAAVAPSISVTPQAAALVAAAAAGGATLASATTTIDTSAARKSREIYIGNLAIGSVTPEMLQELFNAALAGMVPDPVAEPPVLCVKLDPTGAACAARTQAVGCVPVGRMAHARITTHTPPHPPPSHPTPPHPTRPDPYTHTHTHHAYTHAHAVGRFAFVEFRTEELATTAMTLDKTELLGRTMNIGRPKGYIPGASAPAANDTLAAAQQVAAALLGGVTNVVLLEGFMDAATIRATDERQEVRVQGRRRGGAAARSAGCEGRRLQTNMHACMHACTQTCMHACLPALVPLSHPCSRVCAAPGRCRAPWRHTRHARARRCLRWCMRSRCAAARCWASLCRCRRPRCPTPTARACTSSSAAAARRQSARR